VKRSSNVAIIGVGMRKFGRYADATLANLAVPPIRDALADAHLEIEDIDLAFVANSMSALLTGQSSVVGQGILRTMGFSGIPVFNIDNACAGSSSALNLAVQAVRAEAARSVLVVGVEKLHSPDKTVTYRALNSAGDLSDLDLSDVDLERESVYVRKIYPERIWAYSNEHGLNPEELAGIAVKNRLHASLNPNAQYRTPLSIEEVLSARMVVDPITTLMCAPIGDGAAVAIVSSEGALTQDQNPIWIWATQVGMATNDDESTVRKVAQKAYNEASIGPQDVDLAEVHDSIAFNELIAYEQLGFCRTGEGGQLLSAAATRLGGSIPVNTSGGLESRGHPIAATGLAQIFELVSQLRGEAGQRQVPDPRVALAENAGGYAGGDTAALAVTILSTERASQQVGL
jgi:acetyl-CoA acetyltransferase